MLESVDRWIAPHYRSVWEGIYRWNEEHARDAVSNALSALERYPGTPDERAAAEIYVRFLAAQVNFYHREPEDDGAQILRGAIDDLKTEASGPLSRAMRARVLLTLASFAHSRGALELSAEDVERWMVLIPDGGMDHQAWNYLSFWAFSNGRVDLLTQAYRYFLLHPVEFMVDFSRQRIKTMLALAESRCLRADLSRTIELMPNPLHTEWMRWFLVPVCRAQGLWDNTLEQELEAKERELEQNRSVPPSSALRERLRGNI